MEINEENKTSSSFSEPLIILLCKQFALEEGWNWENLEELYESPDHTFYPWSKNHIRKQVFQILNTFAPETEEDNYFKLSTKSVGSSVEINGDLIKHYMETQNLEALLSLFNFLMRCRERAEYLSRSYLNQLNFKRENQTTVSLKPKPSSSPDDCEINI